MSIQVTFTTEQFEKNAAAILAILKGDTAAAADAPAKTAAKEEDPAPAKKPATRKPAAKTAVKEEPKVSLQEAKDALIAVKDDENLGIAEARRIMKEAGVPDAKMANLAQEHAEKVLELAKMLLEGGGNDDEEEEEDL
ncbi:hypothetical protein [Aeromonas phage phiWae15]|nr:hypothetical protein [Aeromonas phage phiWae15]